MAAVAAGLEAPARAGESVRAQAGSIAPMDGLRGVAVAWIVLFHFLVLGSAATDPWIAAVARVPTLEAAIRGGPFAVDLFFLLSGFLLSLPWLLAARRGRPAPDVRRFYARRFWRIVPAYYVQLAALFVVVMPLLHGLAYWRSDLYVYAFNALAHALFLHNVTPLTSGSLGANGALWTLAVEAQFYALLPLLGPLFARAPWRSLALSVAISAAWVAGSQHGFDALVRAGMELGRHWQWPEDAIRRLLAIQFPAWLAHFALGAALARAWLGWRPNTGRYAPAMLFWACIAILAAALAGGLRPLGELSWLVPVGALGGIMLAAATGRAGFAATALGRGPLAFLGRISYSAYLWHLPLLLVLQRHAHVAPWALLPLYLASVISIGWLSWRWIEQPFMRRHAHGSASPRPAP
ncbi:MAG TPA: acyltransferase [Usitatibacter sp.]|nr:acyltransferase [Usitatibacter sp.]